MASSAQQTVESGNTIKIVVDNKPIGQAQSMSASRDFGAAGVYSLGTYLPSEHIHLKFDASLTIDRYRMRTNDLTSLGLAAYGEDILKQGTISIAVLATDSDKVIEVFVGCTAESYKTDYKANEIVGESLNFKYISAGKPTNT